MKKSALLLATGLGTGFSPVAPGTAGTALAAALLWLGADWWTAAGAAGQIILCTVLFFVAVAVSFAGEAHFGKKDPGPVVIDEIVGYFVAMVALPATPLFLVTAFFVFRLLDVVKPWPARESQALAGGWGIVVDDVIAGAYTALCLHLARWIVF
ncbi:MAG: phosphatidylglycerophosphatase A [Candidatus Sumerlaeia bacterium]